ncbi:MAG: glycosyltransferase [Acetobacteraceae bacterium]|nr:glycosyltransferase [Acetobacteraceae bacterium]
MTRGRRIIGYWAWELPEIPQVWQLGARFVHEAWAPSDFSARAVEPLLPGRVRVVPHPLGVVPPAPSRLDRAAFGLPADAVIVLLSLNLASSFARKNPLAGVAAFQRAFGRRTDRILVLKAIGGAHCGRDLARIVETVEAAPNIRLETRVMPEADCHALTRACDIVLSLHRSEGFGLVLAEAMLLGKAVVATGWSGNLTFMDSDCSALVGYRLVASEDDRRVYAGGTWAEPDVAAAAAHLRRLADDAEARLALGARACAAATLRLGAEPLAQAIGLKYGADRRR